MTVNHGPWEEHAVCRTGEHDPDLWFEDTNQARELCGGCNVKNECLFTAMAIESKGIRVEGVWGGLSSIQVRRAMETPSWQRIQKMRKIRTRKKEEDC
jgi:hypothetical protein